MSQACQVLYNRLAASPDKDPSGMESLKRQIKAAGEYFNPANNPTGYRHVLLSVVMYAGEPLREAISDAEWNQLIAISDKLLVRVKELNETQTPLYPLTYHLAHRGVYS